MGSGCPRPGHDSRRHPRPDGVRRAWRRYPILVPGLRRLRPGRCRGERSALGAPRMGPSSHRRAVLVGSRGGPDDHDRSRVAAIRSDPGSGRQRGGHPREHPRRRHRISSTTPPSVGGRNTPARRVCIDCLWRAAQRLPRGRRGNAGSPLPGHARLDARSGRRVALRAVYRLTERGAGRRGADHLRPVARCPACEERRGHRRRACVGSPRHRTGPRGHRLDAERPWLAVVGAEGPRPPSSPGVGE